MHAKSAIAVALLAAAPIVSAGGVTVQNQCTFPVYMWTVSDYSGPMKTLSSGESYSEGYITNPNGGGVSIKLATVPSAYGQVTQFEYTLTDTLWYDMSNINGNPFMQWGMTLNPSTPSCRNVVCLPGVELCTEAYNQPNDNFATAACDANADTSLVLCSSEQGSPTPDVQAQELVGQKKHRHHGKPHHNAPVAPVPTSAPAPPPPAPPVPTPAPAPAQALTTFVTKIVTVTADYPAKRAPAPSAHAQAVPRAPVHRHHHHHHAHRES